ncbi:MAG: hypothetical protein P8X89_24585 [Reinekea sp.]
MGKIIYIALLLLPLGAQAQNYFYLPGKYGVTSGFAIPVYTPRKKLVVHEPMYVEYNGKAGMYGWSKDPELAYIITQVVNAMNSNSAWTHTDKECYRYEEGLNTGLYWYWYRGRVGNFGGMFAGRCSVAPENYRSNRHRIFAPNSKFVSCPDDQKPKGNAYPVQCIPKCSCDEQIVNGECVALNAQTSWDETTDVFFTHPATNHSEAPQTLPNGAVVNRCFILANEIDGTVNNCSANNKTTTEHPIDCATGQKKYTETDYQGFGSNALSYTRSYATTVPSDTSSATDGLNNSNASVSTGLGWQTDIPSLSTRTFDDGAQAIYFNVGSRIARIFFYPAGATTYQTNGNMTDIQLTEDNGQRVVTVNTGQRYAFNSQGQIISYEPKGVLSDERYLFEWDGDLLVKKSNGLGRYLSFIHDEQNRLSQLIDQDGVAVHYQYDTAGDLTKVIYPDGTPADLSDNPFKEYRFENTMFPNNVTGIFDQDGTQLANIAYNNDGKATLSELNGGVERTEVSYPENGKAIVRFYRDVDSTAYREEEYQYAKFRGRYKLTSKTITHCDNCELTTETATRTRPVLSPNGPMTVRIAKSPRPSRWVVPKKPQRPTPGTIRITKLRRLQPILR